MQLMIKHHYYKTGFFYNHGRWALITRRLIINYHYFCM